MYKQTSFPADLLAQPHKAHLAYVASLRVNHPLLHASLKSVLKAIRGPDATLVLLVGPTGVGKTMLLSEAKRVLSTPPSPMSAGVHARGSVVDIVAVPIHTSAAARKNLYALLLDATATYPPADGTGPTPEPIHGPRVQRSRTAFRAKRPARRVAIQQG